LLAVQALLLPRCWKAGSLLF
jgi:hypothetical protein